MCRVAEFHTVSGDFYTIEARWEGDDLRVALTRNGDAWITDVTLVNPPRRGCQVAGYHKVDPLINDAVFVTDEVVRISYDT